VLVSAANQQSTYSLLPVFGAGHGLPEAMLAAMLTALSMGNILLQIPLGLMAERVGGRAMILFCAAATAICAVLLPLLIETRLIWPVLVVMGAVGYGVYTMALVELGNGRHCRAAKFGAGDADFRADRAAGGAGEPQYHAARLRPLSRGVTAAECWLEIMRKLRDGPIGTVAQQKVSRPWRCARRRPCPRR
jgi:hypothetical protein